MAACGCWPEPLLPFGAEQWPADVTDSSFRASCSFYSDAAVAASPVGAEVRHRRSVLMASGAVAEGAFGRLYQGLLADPGLCWRTRLLVGLLGRLSASERRRVSAPALAVSSTLRSAVRATTPASPRTGMRCASAGSCPSSAQERLEHRDGQARLHR